ncbi:MAG TPA: hypothetical protein VE869_02790 [Gemmatimonas sp.]|nr:hypothetical protein [Gemmatimonas sp.]
MGFESSRVARRRLAQLASTNTRVQEALSPSSFPGLFAGEEGVYPALMAESAADLVDVSRRTEGGAESMPASSAAASPSSSASPALVSELDELALDIVATPGAGGALLAAYAAQARALSLVLEAARRAGSAPLPASVLMAAQAALVPPHALAGLALY